MAHLFENNSRFHHLPKPRYTRNKKCYNIMGTRYCSKKIVTFFLIQFLNFKLQLLFKVNILKDAARSGVLRYI